MSNTQRGKTLEQGAAILIFSTILVKIISALFKIPLSADYCLGSLGFGYFSAAHDLFVPINMLAISGFPVAISRLVSDYTTKGNSYGVKQVYKVSKRFLFFFGLFGSVLLCLFVFPFVKITDKTGNSIYSMLAVAPSIVFCSIISCYRGYFEGKNNMTPVGISSILESLGKLVFGLGLTLITLRLTGNIVIAAAVAILGISFGALISLIFLHLSFKKEKTALGNANSEKTSDALVLRSLIIISIPVVLSSVSGNIVSLIDAITVRWQLNYTVSHNFPVLTEMFGRAIESYNNTALEPLSNEALPTFLYGIKSKAFTVYNLVPTFTVLLGVSSVPIISGAVAKCDKSELRSTAYSVIKLGMLVSLPAGLGLMALGRPIMVLLFGGGSEVGGYMLSIYGLAAIFAGLFMPIISVLQAANLQNIALRNITIGLGVKLIANLVLSSVPEINIYGSVLGTLLCNIVIFALNITALLNFTGRLNLSFDFLKLLASALFCSGAAIIISHLGLSKPITVLSILAAAIVYFLSVLLLKLFSVNEILQLPKGKFVLSVLKKLGFYKN